jgi:hypothetical protein
MACLAPEHGHVHGDSLNHSPVFLCPSHDLDLPPSSFSTTSTTPQGFIFTIVSSRPAAHVTDRRRYPHRLEFRNRRSTFHRAGE